MLFISNIVFAAAAAAAAAVAAVAAAGSSFSSIWVASVLLSLSA